MKVLFTPYSGGAIAHVARLLPIADELAARGHSTLFTTSVSKKAFIEAAGHAVHGSGHADVNLNDEHDQGIGYFTKNRAGFMNWLGDELAAAQAFRPDVIVSSPSFFGPIASLKFGIPQVSVINAQWLPEFKGLLGLARSSDSVRHRIDRVLCKPFFERKFSSSYLREIRSFYAELGVTQLPRDRRDLNRHTAVLVPGCAEFEPVEHSTRTDLHYVGPLFWSGFERAEFDRTALFGSDHTRPLVYVSLGGSVYRRQSYEELIAALAARTDWDVLLTLGPNFSREGFSCDHPGFVVQAYTPGHKASAHADIVVTTGGHGTVMQALWHGKPVVALPHNIDQATIAARVEELGVGVNLNPVGLRDFADRQRYFDRAISTSWERVVERTAQALDDKALHENARRFAVNLTRLGDAKKTAADLVERYAGNGPRR
jgi:UDP:flavonoid glycosyltransferase YjiC (YdhE family)